mgnify:CR=1 FL=1|tara:strand:+ start:379 stop:642 length:264 start_codon:yes stop_codon:yes gene_type:complete
MIYDEDGSLACEQDYLNGHETGIHKQYYPGGALKVSGRKLNGEFTGVIKKFWEEAPNNLQAEINFDTNLMKTYFPDGELHTEKTLED